MKPHGIGITADGSIAVTRPSKAEDAIWEAVEQAINEGWTPKRWKLEVAEAWSERLKDDAKAAEKELLK